jgi:hypothetical protein
MGCPLKDMTGLRFGRLLVQYRAPDRLRGIRKDPHSFWHCLCDCGKETEVYATTMRRGEVKSCGCLKRENQGAPVRRRPVEIMLQRYKNGAKRRNLSWGLTLNEFEVLTSSDCHYCGAKPSKISPYIGKDWKYNGVDRIDNTNGYFSENTLPCCETCNLMKCDMSYSDFVSWILKTSKNLTEKHGIK